MGLLPKLIPRFDKISMNAKSYHFNTSPFTLRFRRSPGEGGNVSKANRLVWARPLNLSDYPCFALTYYN